LLGVAVLFWRDWSQLLWPDREAAIRRLEDDNGLAHRPLRGAGDTLGLGRADALTEALWRRHLERQLAAYSALAPVRAVSELPECDPYAVRGIAVLALAAGLAVSGADAPRRIAAALSPESTAAAALPGADADVWVTPPSYTGLPPVILLQAKATVPLDPSRTLSVPAGSRVTVRVGGSGRPSVERGPLDGSGSQQLVPEDALDGAAFSADYDLSSGEHLRIFSGGRKVGDWQIEVLPDVPPSITFDGEVSATARGATRIPYKGGDDYGITRLRAELRLPPESQAGDDPTAEPGRQVITADLALQGKNGKDVKGAGFEDLMSHPWAGLEVSVTLVATDGLKQDTVSAEQRFKLPERIFTDPLAKALIEQRRQLSHGPAAVPGVAASLDAFTIAPELFNMKGTVYLALRSAYWRLMHAQVRADLDGVQALLWEISLALEDGGVSQAAERVRQLQKELQAALDRGASEEEIARLTEELRKAVQDMMQAMDSSDIPMVDGQNIPVSDVEDMLKKIEELAKTGATDAARELLSELQEMMEGMNGPPPPPSEREKQLAASLNELNRIIREEEQLRDRTMRESQRVPGEDPSPEDAAKGDLADGQDRLEKELAAVEAKMTSKGEDGEGERGSHNAPPNIGEARTAMDSAERKLREGDEAAALPDEDEAIRKLKDAREETRQQLAEEQKKRGISRIIRGPGRKMGTDPAGRPDNRGDIDDGSVKIPTERETQRAREIQEELRRKAGETDLPEQERDYLERLLDLF
jgi:uncharacterized protein (TIGR02302 family)